MAIVGSLDRARGENGKAEMAEAGESRAEEEEVASVRDSLSLIDLDRIKAACGAGARRRTAGSMSLGRRWAERNGEVPREGSGVMTLAEYKARTAQAA